jgi:hypothetical protein
MARYYYKDGVKIDVEKIGTENFSTVMDAISRDEDIVTITEEELEEEKCFSFLKGMGAGIIGTGLVLLGAAKISKKSLEKKTKVYSDLYSNKTKQISKENQYNE